MKTLDLLQGSAEWHAHRATHFNASDAPAMMGCSKYKTRSQLLHELHIGITPEVDASQQFRFDEGHRFEALARPLGEQIIGEDLYPVVGAEGKLSASFDGLTMDESIAFEHKSLNDELRAVMVDGCIGADLPLMYRVQMEQQCAVSGAGRVLFMASKWERNHDFPEDHPEAYTLVEERHCWYEPDLALRAQIVAGWAQLAQDYDNYTPPAPAAPALVAAPVQALPVATVQITGEISIRDNLGAVEVAVHDFLDHKLIRKPQTDQDFADLDLQIKEMKIAEESLESGEKQTLAQIQPVHAWKQRKDLIAKLLRDNRLMAEKLLASEKERRRGEIVAGGVVALREHVAALTARIGKPYLPAIVGDFGGAIKGKRSLSSMEEAVDNELSRAKLAANEIADRIQINLGTLRELAAEVPQLFPDTAQIVQKAPEDLTSLVKTRIAEHQAKEQARIDADRERIRREEVERAERIQREAQEAEDALITSIWSNARRIEFDSTPYIQKAIAAFESGPGQFGSDARPRVAAAVASARDEMSAKLEAAQAREQAAAVSTPASTPSTAPAAVTPLPTAPSSALAAAPAPTVIPMPVRAAVPPSTHPTLSLGQIKERIAPLQITAEGLATLGFTGLKERGSVLFHEADFPHVLAAIVAHVQGIQAKQAA